MIHLTLPFPPSTNLYWRHILVGKAVRVLISKRGRQYAASVARCVTAQAPHARHPMGQRLGIHITAHAPDRRARDLDNLLKASLDAMQKAGVFESDSQIDRLYIERGETHKPTGKLEVTIDPLDPTP